MAEWRAWVGLGIGVGLTLIDVAAAVAPPPDTEQKADAKLFEDRFRPLLSRHCVACHGGGKPKGKLRLDNLTTDFADAATRSHWTAVLERLDAGEMPPKGKPRPRAQDVQALTGWLAPRVAAADTAARTAQGRVVLRRLNRIEYENTIRDLLGINVNLKEQLPEDGSADGFDNAGAANHTSSFLIERYLEAADTSLNAAIANRPQPEPSVAKRHSIKDGYPVRGSTENVYRFLKDGEVVCFCSSEWHNVGATQFYPSEGSNYRFRISASAYQSAGKPVTFRVTATGKQLTGKSGLVGYFDAPAGKPAVYEFVRYMEPRTTIMMLPYGFVNASTVHKVGAEKWDGPGLAIQYIDVEGPLNATWPPESHRRIFGDLARKTFRDNNYGDRMEVVSDRPLVDAGRILTAFARRAFRRTVMADDVAPFVAIVQAKLAEGYSFEPAVRAALKGVLISPEFLFLRERSGRLDDFALASRLSYFLWSTMPDDELFTLAEQQKLNDPDVLGQQVERLLASPRAAAFTENFVGQWLGLRAIDATEPSQILYPEFDHLLKVSMIRETELFFDEVLKNDLSLTNFIASDFTMLNGRLARHYGIPGVDGWEYQKKMLPPGSHRGGLLTMASVLKVTANGTTTSPVLRGAWILDRILGTPPPPPPDNVPAIDPDIRGAKTIREQLARHRSIESCAACHRQIDPPGFALENFDCIGGWRDHYRATGLGENVFVNGRRMPYLKGKKVDPADVTADGERFENIDQLKQLLVTRQAATGAGLDHETGRVCDGTGPSAIRPGCGRGDRRKNRCQGLRIAIADP